MILQLCHIELVYSMFLDGSKNSRGTVLKFGTYLDIIASKTCLKILCVCGELFSIIYLHLYSKME